MRKYFLTRVLAGDDDDSSSSGSSGEEEEEGEGNGAGPSGRAAGRWQAEGGGYGGACE